MINNNINALSNMNIYKYRIYKYTLAQYICISHNYINLSSNCFFFFVFCECMYNMFQQLKQKESHLRIWNFPDVVRSYWQSRKGKRRCSHAVLWHWYDLTVQLHVQWETETIAINQSWWGALSPLPMLPDILFGLRWWSVDVAVKDSFLPSTTAAVHGKVNPLFRHV